MRAATVLRAFIPLGRRPGGFVSLKLNLNSNGCLQRVHAVSALQNNVSRRFFSAESEKKTEKNEADVRENEAKTQAPTAETNTPQEPHTDAHAAEDISAAIDAVRAEENKRAAEMFREPTEEEKEKEGMKKALKTLNLCKGLEPEYVPKPTFFEEFVFTNVALMQGRMLAPDMFKTFGTDFPAGVKHSLRFVADSVTQMSPREMQDCFAPELHDRVETGIKFLQERGYKVHWKINRIEKVETIKCTLVVGAQRGERLRQHIAKRMILGQHLIMSMEELTEMGKSPAMQLTQELFNRGSLLLADAKADVTQEFWIEDKEGKVVAGDKDAQTKCTHVLRFEAAIVSRNPQSTYESEDKSSQEPDFESSEWILVDINRVCNGNYPVKDDNGESAAPAGFW